MPPKPTQLTHDAAHLQVLQRVTPQLQNSLARPASEALTRTSSSCAVPACIAQPQMPQPRRATDVSDMPAILTVVVHLAHTTHPNFLKTVTSPRRLPHTNPHGQLVADPSTNAQQEEAHRCHGGSKDQAQQKHDAQGVQGPERCSPRLTVAQDSSVHDDKSCRWGVHGDQKCALRLRHPSKINHRRHFASSPPS